MKILKIFSRIRVLCSLFFVVAFVLVAQLYTLQIVKGADYNNKADNQHFKAQDIFERGSIFFLKIKTGKKF